MTRSLILGVGFWGQAVRWRYSRFRGSKGCCHVNHFWLSMYGVHIAATWRIWLNRPCAAAMRPYVKLLWPLVDGAIDQCCVSEIVCACLWWTLWTHAVKWLFIYMIHPDIFIYVIHRDILWNYHCNLMHVMAILWITLKVEDVFVCIFDVLTFTR